MVVPRPRLRHNNRRQRMTTCAEHDQQQLRFHVRVFT